MTTSRTLEELKLLKSKLVKLAAKEDVETTTEEFVDILSVLEKSNIAADMIQPSKSGLSLGPTVRNFLNKLKEGTAAHDKGRQLLKVWKDIVTRNNIAAAGSKGENRKALSTIEPATFVVNKSVSLAPSIESNHLLAAQPPAQQVSSGKNSINARKAARIVLQTACKDIANAADVERVVNAVEAALDANFSDKEYSSKYRSLAANLKKNKVRMPASFKFIEFFYNLVDSCFYYRYCMFMH